MNAGQRAADKRQVQRLEMEHGVTTDEEQLPKASRAMLPWVNNAMDVAEVANELRLTQNWQRKNDNTSGQTGEQKHRCEKYGMPRYHDKSPTPD